MEDSINDDLDAIAETDGLECHASEFCSPIAVPQTVESERCEGEQTLYAGHLVAGCQCAPGKSVARNCKVLGGDAGSACVSWGARDVAPRL